MAPFDFKTDRKDLYAPPTSGFVLVEVPPMTFLAIDGHGDPNTSAAYREAVEALYAVSYTVKFADKAQGRDIVVGPLEGLWSAADPGVFTSRAKADWDWTMMIRQPDWTATDMLREAIAATARRKSLPALEAMRIVPYAEGTCLQIMHIGAYDDEGPTLARLHDEIMPARGLTWNGPHHEIYLSDPRRVAPEKLKTILRQPVRPATTEPAGVA
ncbi:MAG: GyrI-like domain-containing protein [Thermomicrobiales bacterium]